MTPVSGDAFATFLLGEANSAGVLVTDRIRTQAYCLSGYVQDDWRATSRLTLYLGLRWETELPRRSPDDSQNSFNPGRINPVSGTLGVVTFAGRGGVPRNAFRPDWNNFGPRMGLAFRFPFQQETVLRAGGSLFYASTVSNTIGDSASLGFSTQASLVAAQPELESAMRLATGFPAVQRPLLNDAFGAVPLGERPNTSVGFFKPDQVAPVSYQYNVNVQRELTGETVVEVGYMANLSRRLTANYLALNQVRASELGPWDAQSLRSFPQFSDVYWINPSIGNSSYHGGFAGLERRFHHGFSLLAHYMFSKVIDDVASADEYGDPGSYMDAYNRRLDKGLSGSDVPHRLVATGLYETPSLGSRRWLNRVGGSWRVGTIATLQSGPPFTVTTAANTTNAFTAGPLRPDLVRNPALPAGQRSLGRWFDTDAFRLPAPFRFGNSPRGGLRGDVLQTIDMTVAKEFAFAERYRVDFRGEFYNLLNHANFELPGRVMGAADFGAVLSARAARTIQLGLRLSF
ncbi:MAG: hypothetical protein ACK5AZ_03130 [Bryobacteraceae bacterium]